ncbi:Signal transduction histidine kinase [Eubacterium ruminantium]|nr:Signal transduction histidine kinase [Eubacterium ruminantium]
MRHSIFDRIYLSFLLILILSFAVLITFTSFTSKSALTNEKEETLTNEAQLIASQTMNSYVSGAFDAKDVSKQFNYYATVLNADIWYVDKNGLIVSSSDSKKRGPLPTGIFQIYGGYELNTRHTQTGNFYNIYDEDMISINIPLSYQKFTDDGIPEGEPENIGAIIMHSPAMQISSLLKNIFRIVYLPCLVIIIISFTFIQIVSKKVMSPVKKLSSVATEYSKGNFDTKTDIKSQDEIGQLAQSMEYMADELSKLEQYRRDFISNISHDFRSPLTSIKGYVEAIKDGTIPPEKQDRYLDIILNETQRLTKLTTGLLDLNNLEKYGPYLKLKDFDLIEIIKPTLNTFEMKCIEKNIAIYLNNHVENTMVTADKSKIQQVIYNLIDNAIKFTPSGKKITVTLTDKKEKIFVSVKDEGIGMSEDTQKKIFERFYKGDQSRGKDKQGTGLGLAITKEIIKAHNENIDVISTEGEGSVFTFTLTKMHIKGTTEVLSPPNGTL